MSTTKVNLATEETAVRAAIEAVYDAWAKNDPDAFVAPYSPSATAIHSGAVMGNRDAIRTTIAAAFAGPIKGSRAVHEIQSIRFVREDTAIVLGEASVILAGEVTAAPETRTLDSWVLCKNDGHWRVEAFHNCPEGLV